MNTSSARLAGGILAGLAIGIGGSVAYVKLSERPAVVVQTPAPRAQTPAVLPDAGLTTAAQPTTPVEPLVERQPAKPHNSKPLRSAAPEQVAQNDIRPVAQLDQPPANPYAIPSTPPEKPVGPAAIQEPTSIASPVAAPPATPRVVTLSAGTSLIIRTLQAISTKEAQAGDTFRGTLDTPLILEGAIIAEKGSAVTGRIVAAERAGHVDRHSDLQLQLTSINTSDGQRVSVQTSILDKQGAGNTKGNAEKVGGGAVLGAIIGAIAGGGKGAAIGAGAGSAAGAGGVLVTRGKDVEVSAETQLTFRLSQPVTITEQLH